MKQLQNGVYTFNIGEKNWGKEANQNFEILDSLIKNVADNNAEFESLSEKIQTNAANLKQAKEDLTDNITTTKNELQDQIDILNNNTLALKYRVDNINTDNTGKADKATTLAGYGITDAYTKSEIDNILSGSDADLKAYTDTKVSGLVNSAPETLDTLNELAQALGNDPNFATTVLNQIGTKANADHTHSNYLTGITKAMVTDALGYTPPTQDTNTTYLAGTNLSLSGTTFNVSSTPSFTSIILNGHTVTID